MQKPLHQMDTSKEAEPPYQMTLTQKEEAKNAAKSLPHCGSVRLSLYHRGYSGYSLLPLPRAAVERQIVQRRRRDAEGGDERAHPQNQGNLNDRARRLGACPSGFPRSTGGVPDSTPYCRGLASTLPAAPQAGATDEPNAPTVMMPMMPVREAVRPFRFAPPRRLERVPHASTPGKHTSLAWMRGVRCPSGAAPSAASRTRTPAGRCTVCGEPEYPTSTHGPRVPHGYSWYLALGRDAAGAMD
jgi:hypothetical protein